MGRGSTFNLIIGPLMMKERTITLLLIVVSACREEQQNLSLTKPEC